MAAMQGGEAHAFSHDHGPSGAGAGGSGSHYVRRQAPPMAPPMWIGAAAASIMGGGGAEPRPVRPEIDERTHSSQPQDLFPHDPGGASMPSKQLGHKKLAKRIRAQAAQTPRWRTSHGGPLTMFVLADSRADAPRRAAARRPGVAMAQVVPRAAFFPDSADEAGEDLHRLPLPVVGRAAL